MKRFNSEDISEYGVTPVTGEACGLSMRVLYKVKDEKTWGLIAEFFGMRLPEPNPFVTDGYSSIMLPSIMIPYLFIYLIMRVEGYPEVMYISDGMYPTIYAKECNPDDEYDKRVTAWRARNYTGRIYRLSDQPGNGFRNLHYFTGALQ